MALAHLGGSGGGGDSGSHTISAGASRMALCIYYIEISTSAPSSVAAVFGGSALTQLVNSPASSGAVTSNNLYVFYADEALLTTIGTGAKTLAFTPTGGTGLQGRARGFIHFSGAAQSAPVMTTATNTSGTPSVNAVPAANNAAVVGAMQHNNAAAVTTVGAGYTLTYDADDGGGDARIFLEYKTGAVAGSQAVDATMTSTRWVIAGLVVEELVTASSPVTGVADPIQQRITTGFAA